jgi:hypothetical protein
MAADPSDGVRYLLRGRIADALRTKTAIAISALAVGLIVGMAIGQTVANRSQLGDLSMRIDRLEMQKFDAQKK